MRSESKRLAAMVLSMLTISEDNLNLVLKRVAVQGTVYMR